MAKEQQVDKMRITRNLAIKLVGCIRGMVDTKFHGREYNDKYDKVDFSLTFNGQHYWLVLLREDSKVPIKRGALRPAGITDGVI